MIISAVTGGLLFVASVRPTHAFAMSDSSSTGNAAPTTTGTTTTNNAAPTTGSTGTTTPTTSTTDTSQTTPATSTSNAPTTTTDPSTPTDPTNSTVAGGSTATQNDTSAINSNSAAATTPTTTDPSTNGTDPSGGSSTANQTNNTTVDNSVTGNAQTGDASVTYSPKGGDATTGNASDTSTIVNSSTSSISGGLQSFTYDINGNQNGNVLLNLGSLLANANNVVPTTGQLTTDSQNNTDINNNVNLTATTGNALLANNGTAGNATTGNALTEADIVNLLTSLISDKQAFIGTININGNLNGNILIPANLIDSLLKPTTTSSGVDCTTTTATNNTSINNDVSLTASSGTASEINNGQGGNATSGNATTALNMYNLINNNIVGGNVLLVFVNVVGHWYGLLLNAPSGTTTAALGGGIQQDTVSPVDATATNNVIINNILNLCSTTGNATVEDNGIAGNATTGNATAIADIANVVNSQINLSGWLGILIINVFGTWNGSLGIQPPATSSTVHHSAKHTGGTLAGDPTGSGFTYALYVVNPVDTNTGDPTATTAAQVLGASTDTPAEAVASSIPVAQHIAKTAVAKQSGKSMIVSIITIAASAVVLALSTLKVSVGRKKQ